MDTGIIIKNKKGETIYPNNNLFNTYLINYGEEKQSLEKVLSDINNGGFKPPRYSGNLWANLSKNPYGGFDRILLIYNKKLNEIIKSEEISDSLLREYMAKFFNFKRVEKDNEDYEFRESYFRDKGKDCKYLIITGGLNGRNDSIESHTLPGACYLIKNGIGVSENLVSPVHVAEYYDLEKPLASICKLRFPKEIEIHNDTGCVLATISSKKISCYETFHNLPNEERIRHNKKEIPGQAWNQGHILTPASEYKGLALKPINNITPDILSAVHDFGKNKTIYFNE